MPPQRRRDQNPVHTDQLANERVEYLLTDYDRVTKSLESAKRQLRFHRFCHFAAIAIIGLDSWFSYTVMEEASDNAGFAIAMALLIGATQWQVNTAIFNRRFVSFISPDKNRDGNITASEWARWGFLITVVAAVYALNIGTNMIGVDGQGLGSLAYAVPGIPDWRWIATLTAFFFSALLCFGDELIHMLADDNKAALKRRIPDLENQQAILDARLHEARAFREELLNHAEEQGMRRGANYRI